MKPAPSLLLSDERQPVGGLRYAPADHFALHVAGPDSGPLDPDTFTKAFLPNHEGDAL